MAKRYGALPDDIATLAPSEIQMLLKGAQVRNEKKQRAQKRGSTPSPNQRQREREALQKYA